jgi:hypothetical protein
VEFVVVVGCFEVGRAFEEVEGMGDGLGSFEERKGSSFDFELEEIEEAFEVLRSGDSLDSLDRRKALGMA